MQGAILSVGSAQSLILGDDGTRYTFTPLGWQNQDTIPAVGMRVDFEVRGAHAVGIYPIPVVAPTIAAPPPYAPPTQPAAAFRTSSSPRPYSIPQTKKKFEMEAWHGMIAGGAALAILVLAAIVVLGILPASSTQGEPDESEGQPSPIARITVQDLQTPVPPATAQPPVVSVATPLVLTQTPGTEPVRQKAVSDHDGNSEVSEGHEQSQPGSDPRQDKTPDGSSASEGRSVAPPTPKTPIPTASPLVDQPTLYIQPMFFMEWGISAMDVEAGDSLTLTVRMSHPLRPSEHGGISVSFPLLTKPGGSREWHSSSDAEVEALDYTTGLSNVTFYQPGETIYHRDNDSSSPPSTFWWNPTIPHGRVQTRGH